MIIMLETMTVPTTSVSELKQSPKKVIEKAIDSRNGVYVLNRNKPQAVVLGINEYENMVNLLDELDEKLYDLQVAERLKNADTEPTYSDFEVRGPIALEKPIIDENDGWE